LSSFSDGVDGRVDVNRYHEFSFDLLRYQCVLIVILKDSHILLIDPCDTKHLQNVHYLVCMTFSTEVLRNLCYLVIKRSFIKVYDDNKAIPYLSTRIS